MTSLAGSRRPRRFGRRNLLTIVKIAVSAGLVTVLLARSGLDRIGRTLAGMHTGWLVLGLVLGVVAAMLQANQWRGLLKAFSIGRGYWRVLRLDTAARLFDAALPTNIGGDVIRVRLASDRRADMAPAALAVALRRVMSIPGLLLVIGVSLAGSWHLGYASRVRAVALLCLAGGVGAVVVVLGAHRLGVLRRLPLPGKVEKIRVALITARVEAVEQNRPFWRATARGIAFWVMVVLSQTCYILAVGIHAPIEYSAIVVACVNAISMLPISVGGYGLREGVFSAFLGVGGVGTAAQGTAVGLCLSAQTLAFGLVGAFVYLTMRRPALPPASQQPVAPAAVHQQVRADGPVPTATHPEDFPDAHSDDQPPPDVLAPRYAHLGAEPVSGAVRPGP